jgi:hypothetical protein
MPPRGAKVPFSTGGHPDFTIPESAWGGIEAAYVPLSASARDEINSATARYVDMATAERAAPSALPAKRRINRVLKQEQSALDEINKRNSFSSMAQESYGDYLIYSHLEHPASSADALRPGRERLLLAPVAAEHERVIAACKAALRELEQTRDPGYWRAGSAWDRWIVELTAIAKKHHLPTGTGVTVTIDADKYSPFVKLVEALQKILPIGLQRSTWSQGALNEAIKRARRSPDRRRSKSRSTRA